MIRYVLLIGLILFSLSGYAQYLPNSSQAFQFMSFYNPAFTGIDAHHDVRLGYRYQWAGLDGAPKSVNLSFNTRLRQPLDLTTNALRISNPDAVIVPRKKLTIHGIGVNIFSMSFGQIKTNGASLNYALHYAITKKTRLAAGFSALIEKTSIDINGIELRNSADPFFNRIANDGFGKTDFNLRAGLLLYHQNFYLGFTYLPLIQTSIDLPEDSESQKAFYKGSVQVGYSFGVGANFIIKPSILALLQTDGSMTVDYNAKAYVNDKIWFGFSYRDIKAGVVLFGVNINNVFNVAYAYETSLSTFKTANNGSHEIVLGVKLNNFKRQANYTW